MAVAMIVIAVIMIVIVVMIIVGVLFGVVFDHVRFVAVLTVVVVGVGVRGFDTQQRRAHLDDCQDVVRLLGQDQAGPVAFDHSRVQRGGPGAAAEVQENQGNQGAWGGKAEEPVHGNLTSRGPWPTRRRAGVGGKDQRTAGLARDGFGEFFLILTFRRHFAKIAAQTAKFLVATAALRPSTAVDC
ncbi:MAG TPA: hypothetical protein PKC18_21180 [Lacipirellulaceae bacterium]|nr:hypothetical protein [Lacipirellulaceae bacterium]